MSRDQIHSLWHQIGGSDARTIMGDDEEALLRLWREKRGEIGRRARPVEQSHRPATEDLNRRWFETNTGQELADVQRHVRHEALR